MSKKNQLKLKRIIDVVGALIILLVMLPFAIVGVLLLWLTSGRPLFYSNLYVGLNAKVLKLTKIRTMVKNADDLKDKLAYMNEMKGPAFKIAKDPRIVKFGKWLRKYSLDETPQLLSVIKGDLSLVGPRAPMADEFTQFQEWHKRKVTVKPGLSCLWQIKGRNKINDFDDWVKLDLEYIDNWSLWLDIKILFRTIPVIIFGKGF